MFVDCEWGSNYKIVEGDILHEKVNDPFFNEKRGGKHISRSIPVYSDTLNLYGIADVVEFIKDDNGVEIGTKPGLWQINPVEYKNGKPEKSGADNLQLCAQALCLEEMFGAKIESGDIYYGKLRKRITIQFTNILRNQTICIINEINELLIKAEISPKPEGQVCSHCSLIDICIPAIYENKNSNRTRIERLIKNA